MILALGGLCSIDLAWDYGVPMRLVGGRVAHPLGGRGRRLCFTSIDMRTTPFGEGPHGLNTLGTFRCAACGAVMDIHRSTLRFHSAAPSFTARAKRGLRVIR